MMTDRLRPYIARRDALLALSLALLLFTIYLITYRGGFHSIDEVSMFAVTENLVKFGQLHTDQIAWTQWTTSQREAQGFFGADGHVYSKKGLAQSLAMAPLYGLGLILPGIGMLQTASLVNLMITGATGGLLFLLARRLGYRESVAAGAALLYGLATIAWVYSKYLFSEPLAGLLLLAAVYCLVAFTQEAGYWRPALAGIFAGLAIVTRANNLFLVPIFGIYLWLAAPRSVASRSPVLPTSYSLLPTPHSLLLTPYSLLPTPYSLLPLLYYLFGLVPPTALLVGYNWMRSGNPLQTGYDLTIFTPAVWLGLYKLLLSPLRGLFVYSPLLLLSIPGLIWLWKRRRAEAALIAVVVGATLLLFSAWTSGEGLSWGSRFLVPIVPLLCLALAPVVEKAVAGSRRVALWLAGLATLSFGVQLLGVAINPWVYLARLQAGFGGQFFLEKTPALVDFRYSQPVGQLQSWSLANSDVAWWQPWRFDATALGLCLLLAVAAALHLWVQLVRQPHFDESAGPSLTPSPPAGRDWRSPKGRGERRRPIRGLVSPFAHWEKGAGGMRDQSPDTNAVVVLAPGRRVLDGLRRAGPLVLTILALGSVYWLLHRYFFTDQQFGPPDTAYTRVLNETTSRANPGDRIVTVAENAYHVPMNRFKARVPLLGLARQQPPLPGTADPLLGEALKGDNIWLVTAGLAPAAPENAAERWLASNAFKVSDEWFDDMRLVHYVTARPAIAHTLNVTLGGEVQLVSVSLPTAAQPGRPLPVELSWLALKPPAADYHVFLQLLTPQGVLAAQHDGPPGAGYAASSTWPAGSRISDRHGLALPPSLPAGDYRLIAGLYAPATGQRLASDAGGDFIELGHILVQPSGK